MKIQLKQIHISNFKGIKELVVDFGHVTNIKADNAKGKSTVFDAFCWVLFNKDSHGNSKFHVRPIDKSGKDIDFIEIVVELFLVAGGKDIVIKKTQEQNWVAKKGREEKTFEGNKNKYEWNEIPKTEGEYSSLIERLIDDTEAFMIATNPSFFPNRGWKDQRYTLIQLVSDITDDDVAMTDVKFEEELKPLLAENTIDELKAKYSKAMKEWNKQIDAIPGRIDEVSRTIQEINYSVEEHKLRTLKEDLERVEGQIENSAKAYEGINLLNKDTFDIKNKMQQIEFNAKTMIEQKVNELKSSISEYDFRFNSYMDKTSSLNKQILSKKTMLTSNEEYLEKIRVDFKKIDVKHFDDSNLLCPVCGQDYQESKVDQMKDDFTKHKIEELSNIRQLGKDIAASVEQGKAEIEELEISLKSTIDEKTEVFKQGNILKKELEGMNKEVDLSLNQEYSSLQKKLNNLVNQLSSTQKDEDLLKSLKLEKDVIQKQIDDCRRVLNQKEIIQNAKDRVIELQQEQRGLAQKVADYEKKIFLFEEFTKAKMNMLSNSINSKFKLVNWKLFELQINGGMKECCECTVDGVPYSELNSAMKVSAGLDIINTVSRIYDVQAPIFIDNREGVNEIPDVEAQIINLIVIPKEITADTEIIL